MPLRCCRRRFAAAIRHYADFFFHAFRRELPRIRRFFRRHAAAAICDAQTCHALRAARRRDERTLLMLYFRCFDYATATLFDAAMPCHDDAAVSHDATAPLLLMMLRR